MYHAPALYINLTRQIAAYFSTFDDLTDPCARVDPNENILQADKVHDKAPFLAAHKDQAMADQLLQFGKLTSTKDSDGVERGKFYQVTMRIKLKRG
jgi:hypothetical protein